MNPEFNKLSTFACCNNSEVLFKCAEYKHKSTFIFYHRKTVICTLID